MQVGLVYATPRRQVNVQVTVDEGATVRQAIEKSGLLSLCPEVNLEVNKVGVWGKAVALDSALEDGARIEVYRPITADPKTVKRRNQASAS